MTVFVESSQFKEMLSYQPCVTTGQGKRDMKYNLLDQIKASIGDKWHRIKEGTRQAFDMICFLSAERGFFYASDEYLASHYDISDRTMRTRLSELVALGQVVKVHKRAKKCNGKGKPIYIFVNHPYFIYWTNLLGLKLSDFRTDFHTEKPEITCESKMEEPKKVSTYSLPKNKSISSHQDRNQVDMELKEQFPSIPFEDIKEKLLKDKTAVLDSIKQYSSMLLYRLKNWKPSNPKKQWKTSNRKIIRTELIPEWFDEKPNNAQYVSKPLSADDEAKKIAMQEKLKAFRK